VVAVISHQATVDAIHLFPALSEFLLFEVTKGLGFAGRWAASINGPQIHLQ
jgi:hypothetical protein